MGYTTRKHSGGEITDFWPDDTDTCFYLATGISGSTYTMAELLERAKEKWGKTTELINLEIGAEYIHTSCLYYDRYDSSDYTTFIKVTLIKE